MAFNRQEALELAVKQGMSEKSCDKYLQRMLTKGTIERLERGEYRFSDRYRKENNI
jgi:predicted transcriptional regulator of viral defense system